MYLALGIASVVYIAVSLVCIVLVVGFDVNAIASIGSAVALSVFGLVTLAHLRVRAVTGASAGVLVLAPVTIAVALLVILLLSVALDVAWKRSRDRVATTGPA